MSRKLLAFFLKELELVRIICRSDVCGITLEVPISQLGTILKANSCPVCHAPFCDPRADKQANWLARLAEVVAGLKASAKLVDVEFILPVKPDEPTKGEQ